MKKKLALVLTLALTVAFAAGCSSNVSKDKVTETKPETTVTDEKDKEVPETPTEDTTDAAGALKTGFAIVANSAESADAGEADGLAKTNSLAVAVTVDSNGVITNCVIDSVQSAVNFSKEGKLVTDVSTTFPTKNELGEEYGMKKASAIGKEWNEQADAFAKYVIGKTVDEVNGIAVTEGVPSDADLAASVTIHIGDFMSVVSKAVGAATELGAQPGDKLGLNISTNMSKSKDATADAAGLAQAYSTYSIATVNAEGKVTSCIIDGSQANVEFDTTGKITSDAKAEVKTKNELGEAYGMKAASSIGKEWNEQAAAFAQYVSGKTADEVKGIAVKEGLAADADLIASVTVHITDFMDGVSKAITSAK